MRAFAYERPASLAEAVALLAAHGTEARVLAGGTDLIIRLRDGTLQPSLVVDIKRIPELRPDIDLRDGRLSHQRAAPTMTDVVEDDRDAAPLPGARGGRARSWARCRSATAPRWPGNVCNASPAADTAPPLLVYGAVLVIAGPAGERRLPLDDFFVRSGHTTLADGELVVAIELPLPARATGATHVRRTRRRGHDLASVTLCCAVDDAGVTRIAYGSVGPRPVPRRRRERRAGGPGGSGADRAAAVLERLFAPPAPSPTLACAPAPSTAWPCCACSARRALARPRPGSRRVPAA